LLKGLPLAYQRDLQDDKPPLFGAVGLLEGSLAVMAGLVETLVVDADRMGEAASRGFTTATSVADALVRRGVAFRAAHAIVGSLVASAEAAGIGLDASPDAVIRAAVSGSEDPAARALADDAGLPPAVRAAASVEAALEGSSVIGGTAPARVRDALARAKARLAENG
jgi:argininosuccinate lyase